MTERKSTGTVRIYEYDSTVSQFEATVRFCEKNGENYRVILDRTAFFPTGGGQSCDTGTLGDADVTDVYFLNGEIIHQTSAPLDIGRTVIGRLDYEVRKDKMRSHTAEHILSSVLRKRHGTNNVGFHIGHADTTCDFDAILTYGELCRAEDEVNRIITENHPVYALFPSDDELEALTYRSKLDLTSGVRIVAIGKEGEIDMCACCAPHVPSTGHIGIFRITDFYRYKGGMRIHLLTGQKALDKVRSDGEGIKELSSLLSAKPISHEVISAVIRLCEENKVLKAELDNANCLINEALVRGLEEGKPSCVFDSRTDAAALRRLAVLAYEKTGKDIAVFGGEDENYRFVICGENIKGRYAEFSSRIACRGGGNDSVICGSSSACKNDISDAFHEIFGRS